LYEAKFLIKDVVCTMQKGLFNKKIVKDSDYQSYVGIDRLPNLLSKQAWKDKPFNIKVNGRN